MLLFLHQLFMMRTRACVCMCVSVCVVIVHWHCSAQLSMFNMEKRYRNKILIMSVGRTRVASQVRLVCTS